MTRPVYHSGQREDAPGRSTFWANRQYFPSSCMTNCHVGKKYLVVRLLFSSYAILCTASMVTSLNGPVVIVATDSCYTRVPKGCLHLMKLVPWRQRQRDFTLATSLPQRTAAFKRTQLCILCRKQAPVGLSSLFPYRTFSCTSVRKSSCRPDLCYIHWMKTVTQSFSSPEAA